MTTYKQAKGKTYLYDFWWKPPGAAESQRFTGTTGQMTKRAADRVEQRIKEHVREQAYGVAAIDRMSTPSFSLFANQHIAHLRKKGKHQRLDELVKTLRLCLQFWGRRPAAKKSDDDGRWSKQRAAAAAREKAAPYHDYRLLDPIQRPELLEAFEDWMSSLNLSGGRKNNYRSAMSGLYKTALLPAFRAKTRIAQNPFEHIERDVVHEREKTLTLEQLRAWMIAAPPHTRVAMAIAAYAPELRVGTILQLQWSEHLDHDLTRIVVRRHKTSGRTGRSQIVPITPALQQILSWVRTEQQQAALRTSRPRPTHVVWFRNEPVASIDVGLKAAVERANELLPEHARLTYGVTRGGVTFHTIRHTMATLLAELGVAEKIRQMVMNHGSLATTQKYTHLSGSAKKQPLARLARRLQLAGAVHGDVLGPVPGPEISSARKPQQTPTPGRTPKTRRSAASR